MESYLNSNETPTTLQRTRVGIVEFSQIPQESPKSGSEVRIDPNGNRDCHDVISAQSACNHALTMAYERHHNPINETGTRGRAHAQGLGRHGDTETQRHGDTETRRHGDTKTRKHTQRHSDTTTPSHQAAKAKWPRRDARSENNLVIRYLGSEISKCLQEFVDQNLRAESNQEPARQETLRVRGQKIQFF